MQELSVLKKRIADMSKLVLSMWRLTNQSFMEHDLDLLSIDILVNEYRARHNQRLIDGICSTMACNMFLNMLDFTAQVFRHTKTIAGNILKLK
jgi:Na+/phosphate symporter